MTTLTHSDPTKSPTVVAIRQTRTRLTGLALRRLREGVFKWELQLIESMITDGIDLANIRAVSHAARCLEVLDVLSVAARER